MAQNSLPSSVACWPQALKNKAALKICWLQVSSRYIFRYCLPLPWTFPRTVGSWPSSPKPFPSHRSKIYGSGSCGHLAIIPCSTFFCFYFLGFWIFPQLPEQTSLVTSLLEDCVFIFKLICKCFSN